jgi:flagellar hook assembly protein FlgD
MKIPFQRNPWRNLVWSRVLLALVLAAMLPLAHGQASAQTFQPRQAIHQTECGTYFGIFSKCATLQTNRITRGFVKRSDVLGRDLFAQIYATASHCIAVEQPSQKCSRSVSVSTDEFVSRIVWGQPDQFIRAYGHPGTGAGEFSTPMGVDITRLEGEWHAAFVADAGAGRVDVIALGYQCKCEVWLGSISGAESGTPFVVPVDVAWDPVETWSLGDDRVYVLDRGNARVLVYRVSLYLNTASPWMTVSYITSFASRGTGDNQLREPNGIAVRSHLTWGTLISTDVYISDTGNRRIVHWVVSGPDALSPPSSIGPVNHSASVAGSAYVGLTLDHYGDVLAVDQRQNRVQRFSGSNLTLLSTYGGSATWAGGNYVFPSDIFVSNSYSAGPNGTLIREGLPYAQTVERWGDSTGIQLHRLGVDADNLAVAPTSALDASISFLLTATGSYSLSIRHTDGTLVRTLATDLPSSSGWKTVYWDGRDNTGNLAVSFGWSFRADVVTRSGYTYDAQSPRTVSQSFTFPTNFQPLWIDGPTYIDPFASISWTARGTNSGSVTWYRSYDGGASWNFLGSQQTYTGSATDCNDFDLKAVSNYEQTDLATLTVSVNPNSNCEWLSLSRPALTNALPTRFQLEQDLGDDAPTLGLSPRLERVPGPLQSLDQGSSRSAVAQRLRMKGIMAVRVAVPKGDAGPASPPGTPAPTANLSLGRADERVKVTLKIFTVSGALVKAVLTDDVAPGYYRFEWDGLNDQGIRVAPGAYVITMTSAGFSARTKLVVVR